MSAVLPGVRLGIVRGITCGSFGEPGEFVPAAADLGAGLVRLYLYWNQIEPEPGRFDWDVVDEILKQSGDRSTGPELWVTVCSSSMWATRSATDLLPPSPAKDVAAYARFVRALVTHCAGRVQYWQCDNEPSVPFFWAGSAAEYLQHLEAMHRAVRETDPDALVVLGGMPPGVVANDDDPQEQEFFATLLREGGAWFDVLDVHLYGDPYLIPQMVAKARDLLAAAGLDKPVVAGEYGGPTLFEYPEAMGSVMDAFTASMVTDPMTVVTVADHTREDFRPVARAAMVDLYARMADLPPQVQMLMEGCPPELEALRHRIHARQVVVRTVLALAAGVPRTACWNLAREADGPESATPYDVMALLFDKFRLMEFADGRISHRNPAADAFALLAAALAGVEEVQRLDAADEDLFVFAVRRARRGPLVVAWQRRDDLDGEQEAPIAFTWPWPQPGAVAVDALGAVPAVTVADGRVRLPLDHTPVLITAG